MLGVSLLYQRRQIHFTSCAQLDALVVGEFCVKRETVLLTVNNVCRQLWWEERQGVVDAKLLPEYPAICNHLASTHQKEGVNLSPWNTLYTF